MSESATLAPVWHCGATCRDGHPCGQPKMRGQARCRKHGGKAPQTLAAAQRRLALSAAERVAARHGVPITNPLAALAHLAGEITSVKEQVASRLDALEDLDPDSPLVTLYLSMVDRAARVLRDLGALNVDERLARVSEAQAAALLAVVERILSDPDAGLADGQRLALRQRAARELRMISA